MEQNNTIFYGSLYEDEFPKYKEKIEEQFRHCAKMMKEKDLKVVTWAFDSLILDPVNKKIADDFVKECANIYFPGVPHIDDAK